MGMDATIVVNGASVDAYKCKEAYERHHSAGGGPTKYHISYEYEEGYGTNTVSVYFYNTHTRKITEKFLIGTGRVHTVRVPKGVRKNDYIVYICLRGECYDHHGPFFDDGWYSDSQKSIAIRNAGYSFFKTDILPYIEKEENSAKWDKYTEFITAHLKNENGNQVWSLPDSKNIDKLFSVQNINDILKFINEYNEGTYNYNNCVPFNSLSVKFYKIMEKIKNLNFPQQSTSSDELLPDVSYLKLNKKLLLGPKM